MLTSGGFREGQPSLNPPTAEGDLDAVGAFEVADGVEELAFRDGGVPALGLVAVAALQLAHRVAGVAEGVDELAGLVRAAWQEPVTTFGPPRDFRHRFVGAQDRTRLPLDPQGTHLERTREHAQGSQGELVIIVEAEERLGRIFGFPAPNRS